MTDLVHLLYAVNDLLSVVVW